MMPPLSDHAFNTWLQTTKDTLSRQIEGFLDSLSLPYGLQQAIHYAVFSGGKRLRPLILLAVADTYNITREKTYALAVSLELMHAYSLVHDDLPGMDNDCYRRGSPTVHIAFDHATAILVGDALQALAYQSIYSCKYLSDSEKIQLTQTLLYASGAEGMISGQYLDWQKQIGSPLTPSLCSSIHKLKTGLCLQAPFTLPRILATDLLIQTAYLVDVGDLVGKAFQYLDDHLDSEQHGTLDNQDCPPCYNPPKNFTDSLSKAQWLYDTATKLLENAGHNPDDLIYRMVQKTLPVYQPST